MTRDTLFQGPIMVQKQTICIGGPLVALRRQMPPVALWWATDGPLDNQWQTVG